MATILVVDDRPTNREFLTTLLGYAGHRLLEAADALEGLERTRAEHPDLVIADVLMPAIDGFEFVRRLRADPTIAETRVVFYTAAYLEGEARELARSCGVTHILTKPSEPQLLMDIVREALAEDGPPPAVPAAEHFDREHSRVLLDKLTQKVDELEAINTDLERRVEERTAELASANERLQELNRLKDEFLTIASHDMRSPLGSIQVMADMLLEEFDDLPEDPHRRFLGHIRTAAHHLIGLVSNLLDLSKIESGQAELDLIDLHISHVARQAIDVLRSGAAAKQIDVQLDVAPGEPRLRVDQLRLSQIFHNLVSNAIKFTPAGGRIIVRVEPEPGGVRVGVADSGLGIAPEDLPRLFEKFQRVHLQGTAGEKGSGLGLAIVRQLVHLHGGSIELASEVGRGSTFTIHLPLRY